ncbi:6857_t:CDS:2 [Ambispora gerdemannii]|uniref:6857_t:CDS:1 n=1 Tax=Ambispora gerdemannii TaxID=144530 RepID=A0A9N8W820_9GLOM|nr:6857_t:CDS:2 [Ambispora gerdemannii]
MKQSVRFNTTEDDDDQGEHERNVKHSNFKSSSRSNSASNSNGKVSHRSFHGKTFKVHGFEGEKRDNLENFIEEHGGTVLDTVDEQTSYVVTSKTQMETNSPEYEELIGYNSNAKIVDDKFVYNKVYVKYKSGSPSVRNRRGSYDQEGEDVVEGDEEDEGIQQRRSRFSNGNNRKSRRNGNQKNTGSHSKKRFPKSGNYRDNYFARNGLDREDEEGKDDEEGEYFPRRTKKQWEDESASGSDDSENIQAPGYSMGNEPEVDNNEYFDNLFASDASLTGDAKKERIAWQSMLSSVLTGEVIKSEKRRLSGSNSEQAANTNYQIWLGVRAITRCHLVTEEKSIVEQMRQNIDEVLQEVIDFAVKPGHVPALDQVKEILERVRRCETLYPSRRAMMNDKPLYKSKECQYSLDALNSWLTITESLQTQLKILQNWTGSETLEIARPKDAPANAENSSFIERILKENGLKRTFDKQTLYTLHSLLAKAKLVMIDNANAFAKMNLPPYRDELQKLLNFPTKLMEECMKLLLEYPTLTEPTILMIEQQMEDFRVSLELACKIKHQYLELIKPAPGWEIPPCIDENYNFVLLNLLQFYFKLLQWKLKDGAKTLFFKEAEILEYEWSFLSEICQQIGGGDSVTAEQVCSLTRTLLLSVMKYFESQLTLPAKLDANDITKRYNKILETVRLRARKILRFTKFLFGNLENSADYFIDDANYPAFIEALERSNHVLVYPDTFEENGVCIVVDPSLECQPEMIRKLLKAVFPLYEKQPDNHDEELEDLKYLLILSPRVPFEWNGPYVNISLEGINIELKNHRTRLVADAAYPRLQACRQKFRTAVEGVEIQCVSESRANVQSVNREMQRIKKTINSFVTYIIESVSHIREIMKNIECQELIENFFSFAAEFGQRCMRYMHHHKARNELNIKLNQLAIDWVSFICDDCEPTDRKTFRWAVIALEFAMATNRGFNILGLEESDFSMLRSKVSICMTLLISHFDILGARSTHETQERQRQEAAVRIGMPKYSLQDYDKDSKLDGEEALIARDEWIASLKRLEAELAKKKLDQGLVGKVLDDNQPENKQLVFLASSSTNISLRWQQGKFLGGGTFGSVYVATNMDSGEVMAVKEIRFQDPSSLSTLVKSVKEEMSVMELLNHPNIVSYYGIEVHRDRVYIFMEYCQGGSLGSLLEHGRIEAEYWIQFYTYQMLLGLIYLHENNIVHRDIKPDNILLDHEGNIKFVDFGAAKILAKNQKTLGRTIVHQKTHVHSLTGTPMYMAPEIITGEEKGRKGSMDIWSLGCCVLEMATGRRPWSNLDNEWAVMYHVVTGHPPLPDPSQLSELGMDFLKKCFTRSSAERPTARELLEHSWIQEQLETRGDESVSTDWTPMSSDAPSSNGTTISNTTGTSDSGPYFASTNMTPDDETLVESDREQGPKTLNIKNDDRSSSPNNDLVESDTKIVKVVVNQYL